MAKGNGRPSPSNPKGSIRSNGEMKFPTDSPGRARNAMARLDQAKPPLSMAEKKKVARAVEKELGKSTPATRKILGKGTKNGNK